MSKRGNRVTSIRRTRVFLPGHARWLLHGFGYIGQSIIIRFCLTTCHCVHANCHAHWLNTLGPSQRGQRMGSCFVESYVFSLVGTCTFEQDSFSPIFWRASRLGRGCARKDIKKYSVYRSTIPARASLHRLDLQQSTPRRQNEQKRRSVE
jgi:hypothetical protein